MIKAIKSLSKSITGFFTQVIDALFSIPDYIASLIDLLVALVESVINIVSLLFSLFSSLDDGLDFLSTGLLTVTAVLRYMPEPLAALCMTVISILVVRMFLDLL